MDIPTATVRELMPPPTGMPRSAAFWTITLFPSVGGGDSDADESDGEASGDDLFADDDSDAPPPKKRKGSKRPPF